MVINVTKHKDTKLTTLLKLLLLLAVASFTSYFFRLEISLKMLPETNNQGILHAQACKTLLKYYTKNPAETRSELFKVIENNQYSTNLYYLVGILGDVECKKYLLNKIHKHEETTKNLWKSDLGNILLGSVGFIKHPDVVSLVDTISFHKETDDPGDLMNNFMQAFNYTLARVKYLLEGKRIKFESHHGGTVKLPITVELEKAGDIISDSAQRMRNINELEYLLYLYIPVRDEKEQSMRFKILEY